MRRLTRCVLGLGLLTMLTTASACAQPPKVEVVPTPDGKGWVMLRGGEPYEIKGIGGYQRLELFKSLGGNSFRTWGHGQLEPQPDGKGGERSLLDTAQDLGLTVCAGFWVGHPRHDFDYSDEQAVQAQRDDLAEFVSRWKHHPAVLVWTLGNEVELGADPEVVFPEINRLAKIAKEIDPSRPTMTVLAGVWGGKMEAYVRLCPDVDILGVNAYAGLPAVRAELDKAGYTGPVIMTEYGPPGHWERPSTGWDAPIEPSSSEKARHYANTHDAAIAQDPAVLGGYVFLWGQKQERTKTWYGMFLRSGEATEAVEVMAERWGGTPKNRAPTALPIESSQLRPGGEPGRVAPGARVAAAVDSADPDGDPLEYEWFVEYESTDRRMGGDREAVPDRLPIPIEVLADGSCRFAAPAEPGQYRLFVIIRDGNGAAGTANLPFLVEAGG